MLSWLTSLVGPAVRMRVACIICFDPVTGDIGIALLDVDDIMVCSSSDTLIDAFYSKLNARFGAGQPLTWEPISSFLGINICYDRHKRELSMDVAAKIATLFSGLSVLRMLPTKAPPLPGADGSKRQCAHAAILEHICSSYSSIAGGLIYMAISCQPDIRYAEGRLYRHMHTPTDAA